MRIVECVNGRAAGTVDDAKQVSFGAVVVANMPVLNGAITGMLPNNAALEAALTAILKKLVCAIATLTMNKALLVKAQMRACAIGRDKGRGALFCGFLGEEEAPKELRASAAFAVEAVFNP